MADNEAQVLGEAKKLSYADRLAHANWKVRSAAYDDINAACNGVYDPNDPCLQEFGACVGCVGCLCAPPALLPSFPSP